MALVEIYEVAGATVAGSPPFFTAQPASQTVFAGQSYTFGVSVAGPATFQWYLDGNAIPGADASTYAATQAGTYDVVATNAYGSTTSSLAAITFGSGITAPVTDLAEAAGNLFYVTFGQDVFHALGLMPQDLGVEVEFSWDEAGTISGAMSGMGPTGNAFTIKTNGEVGIGAGSAASGTPIEFDWTYSSSNGVLISIYFDGGYNPATPGQDIGTFEGLATVLYEASAVSDFADINFVAAYSLSPPSSSSF